jgi:hypothetical protein
MECATRTVKGNTTYYIDEKARGEGEGVGQLYQLLVGG